MPCVSFHCPGKPFRWVTIDNCTLCEERCMPIELLRWIWKTSFEDTKGHYHEDPKVISATSALSCPRRS